MMKKNLLALIALFTMTSVMAQQAVITGKFAEKPSPVMGMDTSNPMSARYDFPVNDDGTFTWTFDCTTGLRITAYFEEPHTGFMFYVEPGLKADLQISFVKAEMMGQEVTQCKIDYTGDYKDVFDYIQDHNFFDAQNKAISAIQQKPDMTFAEWRALFRYEMEKGKAEIMQLSSPTFRQYMTEDYEKKFPNAMWWYMEYSSTKDEQFQTFAESVDHNSMAEMTNAQMYASYYKKYNTPEGVDPDLNFYQNIDKIYRDPQVAQLVADMTIGGVLENGPASINDIWAAYKQVKGGEVAPELQAQYEKYAKMARGSKAMDFDFYDKNGKKLTLSKLKGKAVYFDIWATWCGPCCAEIPNMEKLAEHYKDSKDVQIISVSLDQNKQRWLDKIAKDKPQWPQYIVKDDFNSVLCKEYNITGIPRFMMFDKNGCIVSIDAPRPSSPDIIEWIDSHLK